MKTVSYMLPPIGNNVESQNELASGPKWGLELHQWARAGADGWNVLKI